MERTYYHHGLAVAVKANLPAAERARVDESAGQALVLEVAGRDWCFLWQKPDMVSEGGLSEHLAALKEVHPEILFAGDWNATLGENHFSERADYRIHAVRDCHDVPVPTRWKGNRAMDYLICNPLIQVNTRFLPARYGDQKAVFFDVAWESFTSASETVMVPTRAYDALDGVNGQAWGEAVTAQYAPLPASCLQAPLSLCDVQRQWHAFNQRVEQAFRAAHEAKSGKLSYGLHRIKGSPPHVVDRGELAVGVVTLVFAGASCASCWGGYPIVILLRPVGTLLLWTPRSTPPGPDLFLGNPSGTTKRSPSKRLWMSAIVLTATFASTTGRSVWRPEALGLMRGSRRTLPPQSSRYA